MNLRIQTYGEVLPLYLICCPVNLAMLGSITVYDALEKGLDDLRNLCGVVIEKFEAARNVFDGKQQV